MSVRWMTALVLAVVCSATSAEPVMLFNFSGSDCGWHGNPRVADFHATAEGISFHCTGEDPWIEGPASSKMPLGRRLKLIIRMRSQADNVAEIFYGPQFVAGHSVQVYIKNDGQWHDYEVLLPPQKADSRLRIDPANGESGEISVAWIKADVFQPVGTIELKQPDVPKPGKVKELTGTNRFAVEHYGRHWNDFALICDSKIMAWANPDEQLGIVTEGKTEYINLRDGSVEFTGIPTGRGGFGVKLSLENENGVHWTLQRKFENIVGQHPGIAITTTIMVDRDTDVFHLPWVTMFPGLGSYGEHKTQALLPGVEYLADEPSSNEADLRGEQAIRRIVDDVKLTMTMMAVVAEGNYLTMIWDRADHPAPVFDTPDRMFDSGAQVWGLWWPPVGEGRLENSLEILRPVTLKAGRKYSLKVILTGGSAESVVPAIQAYVALKGLAPVPEFDGGKNAALRLMAHGWADSAGYVDGRWRHAVWGTSFPPQPAADALVYMQWIRDHLNDSLMDENLTGAFEKGRRQLPEPTSWLGGVGHVQRPLGPLVKGNFDAVSFALTDMMQTARRNLTRFDEQGIVHYKAVEGRPDYGSTHFVDHANGLTADPLEQILMAAAFSGDPELISQGLALLDKQTGLYGNTVPRGAQTWEVPLHTPDILASAKLVHCYVLAYQLTGEMDYLDQARYWAWTGLSFVYMDAPTDGPVGIYGTIAVIGATNWQAPNWIGLPVQWCGLVYRSALHELARVDSQRSNLWRHVADGITASGLQMTFPPDDEERQGLLPDSFVLRPQIRQGPAINPGTVQAGLPELYGMGTMYDLQRLPNGLLVHAPGVISGIEETADRIIFDVDPWTKGTYRIQLTGKVPPESVQWGNESRRLEFFYRVNESSMTIEVAGKGRLTLLMAPKKF